MFLRVFGLFGGLLFAVTLLYGLLIIPQQKRSLLKILYSQASTVSSTILQGCADAMLTDDFGFVVEYNLQVMKNNNSVRSVIILPKRGNALRITPTGWAALASSQQALLHTSYEHEAFGLRVDADGTSYYHFNEPILFSGTNWGTIQIDFNTSEYDANINEMYRQMSYISIISILLVLPIGYFFAIWLTRPITTISQAAARVANGDLEAHVAIDRNDEIGDLFDSFNQMVDALKRSSNQLQHSNLELEHKVAKRTTQLLLANHSKDSFLATMSHEIRTPLGGLMGMMELLDMSQLDAKQREMVQAARKSGNSLLRIVNDILDWSKIEAGKLELAPHAASIRETLQGVVNTYSQLTVEKDIQLKFEVDPELSAVHLFDPLRLSQILNNFTSNALKFTKLGIVEISAQRVTQNDVSEEVRFSVKDTGVGIDQEHQSRLFHNYEQASASTARMYGGTGLGLAICRRLAELMGGTLSVESTPGVGSTFSFTVRFPIVHSTAKPESRMKHTATEAPMPESDISPLVTDGQHISALLVDDHPLNRMLLKQQLGALGLHAVSASDGAEALALWKENHIDLVITDCHMPGMDGYEFTRNIREMERQTGGERVPIIAWTANVLTEEEERCYAAGMDDLLTKPTELADLRTKLLEWLVKANVLTMHKS